MRSRVKKKIVSKAQLQLVTKVTAHSYFFLIFPYLTWKRINFNFKKLSCIVSNFSDSSREILSHVSLKFADNLAKNQF